MGWCVRNGGIPVITGFPVINLASHFGMSVNVGEKRI